MKQFEAMTFSMRVHAAQKRKYTGNPYAEHLAEVAGIVACVAPADLLQEMVSIAWLHDCIEDQGVTATELERLFGGRVADGVVWLSDMEKGNRAERKAASRARLSMAPAHIQTIKCADLISNTGSIVLHDPVFAATYLEEKRLLLDVLHKADPRLVEIARSQVERGQR